MTIGTDLEVLPPASPVIAGSDAERLPSLHTNASSDHELLAVWLRSHADGSPHTRRAYERIGRRFVDALAATGADLRRHTHVLVRRLKVSPTRMTLVARHK